MSKISTAQDWVCKFDVKLLALYASIFFLPVSYKINNTFLVIFIIIYLIEGQWSFKISNIKKNYQAILSIGVFFFFYLIGVFYSEYTNAALSQIERSLPLVAIPIIILSEPKIYVKKNKTIFFSLVYGCLLAVIICWGNLLLEIFKDDGVINLFKWEYSKFNLIKPLKQHSPYLAMFLVISIGFLIRLKAFIYKPHTTLHNIVLVVLIAFLFHLMSRTAIIFFILSSIIYFIYCRKYLTIIGMIILASIAISFLNKNDFINKYYEGLLVDQMGLNGIEKVDERFQRLNYSLDLFFDYPLLGAGTGDVDLLRSIKYGENGDTSGFKNGYNAHNQFLEFLSGQGIFAGAYFLFFFFYLFKSNFEHKKYFFLFTSICFFICCLTESMLRVTSGIVFFSLLTSLNFAHLNIKGINEQ